MTIIELSILKKNGDEVTLNFSDTGVLKKKLSTNVNEENPIETHYLRKNPDKYVGIIGDVLKNQNINDAVALSGVFRDDDGSIVEQEGVFGNIFYSNVLSTAEMSQGE